MAELPPGWTLYETTSSTNDTVHEAAANGAPEGTLHLARTQTGGRGRAGRSWWNVPDSALLMTVLLRPQLPPHRVSGLSLLAGRAVKKALEPLSASPPILYWPNDLHADRDRKLGGILCEMRARGGAHWIALGIGINIDLRDADIPVELRGRVASLADLRCEETDPVELAQRIVASFWPLYTRLQRGEPIAPLIASELAHVGGPVTVRGGDGGETLRGAVDGIGERGELLVRDSRGVVHAIIAGDVDYE